MRDVNARALSSCPVCGVAYPAGRAMAEALAAHLAWEAERSDVSHVMWLNRNITKHRVPVEELAALLRQWQAGGPLPDERVQR